MMNPVVRELSERLSLRSRHILALLWLTAIAAGPLALSKKSVEIGLVRQPARRLPACRPEKPEKCISEANCLLKKRHLTSDQIDKIFRDHQAWLKAVDDKQLTTPKSPPPDLSNADLPPNVLSNRDLRWANLKCASLPNANLRDANLRGAEMACIDLRRADLRGTHLERTDLTRAQLCDATLDTADLNGATLIGANLTGASLYATKMEYAILPFSVLADAQLGIEPNSLPFAEYLQLVRGLDQVKLDPGYSPAGLYKLRARLREVGLRDQERDVTTALRRAEMEKPDHTWLERTFNTLLFDDTCEYGRKPGGALKAFGFCLLAFAIIYVFAQMVSSDSGAIWAVWDPNRIRPDDAPDGGKLRLDLGFPPSKHSMSAFGKIANAAGLNVLGLAIWFSILSATQIGWQAFNFGLWFNRIQPREYGLRATGWVRVASGIQSLISVYFIALWFLTYFGTPFE